MNTPLPEASIFDELHNKEVFLENYKYDSRKTMTSLIIIGCVLFASDLLALAMANAINAYSLISVLIAPALFTGLGFLARIKPILSMIIAAILFALIIILNIYLLGGKSIVSGLLVKAVVIYFFIKGFNHAKDAEQAKRTLSIIS